VRDDSFVPPSCMSGNRVMQDFVWLLIVSIYCFPLCPCRNIGYLQLLFPDACVLHAVRHPADVALSCYEQNFSPALLPWAFNLTHAAATIERHHAIMAHWDAVFPGTVLDVHYSDMIRDLEGTMRKALSHCRMPWDGRVLRYWETPRAVFTASQLQVRKPIYGTSMGKWKYYKAEMAGLLHKLYGVIVRYEAAAKLPSSAATLKELFAGMR